MRKTLILTLAFLASSGVLFAQASGTGPAAEGQSAKSKPAASKKADPDRAFALEAADGGMAEVALGKLATEKASDPDVKQFGQRMVDDHSKANDQLKSIAGQLNYTLPGDMSHKHKTLVDKLSKLNGPAFDKAYMDQMVDDHLHDVAAFHKEATGGQNEALKNFAAQTEPTLREHLKSAKEVSGKVGNAAKKGSVKKTSGNRSEAIQK